MKKNGIFSADESHNLKEFSPHPVFIHYDRGLQEYADLFSDEANGVPIDAMSNLQREPLVVNETAETQSHRS
jgi:hypothetical protein